MNFNKVVSNIVNAFKKAVVNEAATKGAAVQAEAEKAVSATKAAKIANALKPFLIVSAADAIIGKIPVLNEIVSRIQQVKDTMLDKTVGQIPIVGKPWMEGNRLAMSMLMPSARKYVQTATPESLINAIQDSTSEVFGWFKKKDSNDNSSKTVHINNPKFYERLGMHIEFKLATVYPDVVGVPYAGNKNYGSIGFMRLRYNPMTSYNKIQARYTQLLDLLKGVRGLSGEMPYTEGDIYFYDWNTKYLVTEYYKLKYCLKLSNIYSMTKNTLPKYLISQIGFNADDFISNKALYIELLVSMHEFIQNTVPNFGVLERRICDLLYKLIPDSNDANIALYYCIMLTMYTLVPDAANNQYLIFGEGFTAGTPIAAGAANVIEMNPMSNMTYSTYYANFSNYSSIFPSKYRPFGSIRGDLVGSFGKSIFWCDKNIKDIENTKEDAMYHKFDELFLTQLQNATICHNSGVDALPGGTVEYTSVNSIQLSDMTLPLFVNGRVNDLIHPTGGKDFALIEYVNRAFNPQGSAGVIHMPQSDGVEALNSLGLVTTAETAILQNKAKYSEGESLEILQLIAWVANSTAWYDGNSNYDYLATSYQTMSFYLDDYKILFYDVNNAVNTYKEVEPTAIYVTTNITGVANGLDSLLARAQFWSQADYGTKLPLSVITSNIRRDYLLLDFNIMGSISRKAFQTAVLNSAYSLYSADIKVGPNTNKRIANLVEAFRTQG